MNSTHVETENLQVCLFTVLQMFNLHPNMAIGKQIKLYREMLGWTLQQLSDASEVDVGTISALELRDSSRSRYFIPIARAFGLTLEQLSDTTTVFTPKPPDRNGVTFTVNEAGGQYQVTKGPDPWITEAVTTLEKLDDADRRAAVLNLRTFVLALGPRMAAKLYKWPVKKREPQGKKYINPAQTQFEFVGKTSCFGGLE